jgi:hypothetical protein
MKDKATKEVRRRALQLPTAAILQLRGVKLRFMFQNVVRSRGTILQQVGFNIPLRSIFKASYARNCK